VYERSAMSKSSLTGTSAEHTHFAVDEFSALPMRPAVPSVPPLPVCF
jgi:hypothetical protein